MACQNGFNKSPSKEGNILKFGRWEFSKDWKQHLNDLQEIKSWPDLKWQVGIQLPSPLPVITCKEMNRSYNVLSPGICL